ncbi:T9SS type A sorting domain-containing protein [Chryseobacterium sp. YR221]|uniref:T9SS type A sorting domain-containing protein n=1 Tax=Chryseobacterium sp. YR221 TaxID=1500293 RepID=UPI0009D8C7E4|nr:T9SS type A sorting domain-containing protein [Chryseobacterium sp. YR221]SMC67001.1 Por secretion system C-terminal sorting domain-containing protein [Chryseobacterium sp. YR221]
MKKILLLCLFTISMVLNAQINLGEGSTETGNAPINPYYGYSYIQQIFTKQEINANAAGNITGVKFYLDASASIDNSSDWVVYLGHTAKTNFTSDDDWIPVAQLTQVYAGTVTNANGVIEITFATPFPYNNTQNLVIAAEENSQDYDDDDIFSVFKYGSVTDRTLSYSSDSTNPDPASPPTGDLLEYRSVVSLMGLTINPIPACPMVGYPGNNSTFIPVSPDITWNAPQGATGYKISIGTTPGGTDIVNQQSVTTNNFTPTSPLAIDTDYYLKVTAVGAGGESVGCSVIKFRTAPAAPANDDCTDAVVLTVNPDMNCGSVASGYTLGASDSGLLTDPCYGDADDDVWFKFTATGTSHVVTLSNVVSIGSDFNDEAYYQVFSGDCANLVSTLCGYGGMEILTGLTAGNTYYIRVYSYGGAGEAQSFNLCVGTIPPPPANDECSGALTAAAFPYTYTQSDAAGATNNGAYLEMCTNGMNDGTWFTFTGDGSTFDITVTTPADSYFDSQIGVFSGACGSLTCVDTIDGNGSGETETISIPTVAGTVYYVNVGNYSTWSDDLEGTFTISINKENLATSETSKAKNTVQAYPNPFTEVLNISKIDQVKSISISDISGRLMKSIDQPASVLQLGDLKSGIYLVTLNMKDGSKQTIKAIKK